MRVTGKHFDGSLNPHRCYTFDITMHDKGKSCPDGDWAQATYLVHGWDDVLWTDDLAQALEYLRESCQIAMAQRKP